jgi:hypothetical protein
VVNLIHRVGSIASKPAPTGFEFGWMYTKPVGASLLAMAAARSTQNPNVSPGSKPAFKRTKKN